ncbi:hypothetical protein A3F32_02460 [Candidatus Roizmanbacteria bacterium RIFCSPHIGHO2_12_FULL_42_10]|uniref:Ribulose-phosphate 3-epimerase n=2 Tax=Candidatus Roizmaniibacteriota TaxID=1752723 RepID=A0A1F7I5M1_9BACT|nr:MAG: hypothetical protein A3D08_02290 [Candidatus Roizmanbacteria bacterium RIFCSPHIGHO2_02_FULL_43_11]OGK38646.1 MAG: hypothetical protein A3F32_02460 [Candidatus Roizmanbacteria bacterium RIFCSPHIGHO2_12_FULL_42_10]
MKIFPTILEQSAEALYKQIANLSSVFQYFQIDIADGQFVDGETVSIDTLSKSPNKSDFLLKSQSFPNSKSLRSISCEFHLMVSDIPHHIESLGKEQAFDIQLVIVHLEAAIAWADYDEHIDLYAKLKSAFPFEFGIAISPETPLAQYLHSVLAFPVIQIMTVQPGAQGRPFMPSQLEHIATLREAGYMGSIQIDGGVNEHTLPIILQNRYWPDAICPGSFLREKPAGRLRALEKLIDEAESHRE